ncbi:DUF58 domain-containing protein [Neptuniibacter sp. 2_MG-2023]|uniref:DUF58 domain-containing protein n=1 Tax=Neptuniibacter sp. 2_MG-2023 TaxID=3062671 RepID=UPI0026E3A142|nr:DUF58 domain-containing protein [Neptuniibacter sp. 2_MG-2023]MDO6515379.1 DUF58 domain-containing protein [Neptuniibacter sp. 2_MG-2023]
MFQGDSPRPIPAARNLLTLDELVSLRHWPPARGRQHERMAIREGHHLSHIRGRGMEFDDVREYQPGDDIRHLDWRLMARTGKAHTKLYREERERPVFVLTDLRQPMHFATRGHYKSVLAAYAAAMVVWTTIANGDRVGGRILNDGASGLFKPTNNRQQVMQMISALSTAFSHGATETTNNASFAEQLMEVESLLSSGTIIYMFSDFHDVDSTLQQHLMRIAQRCELKMVLISDPLEAQLPSGRDYRFIGEGREVVVDANTQQQAQYYSQFQQRIDLLEQLHNLRGVEFAHWQSNHHPLFTMSGGQNGL